MVLATTDDRLLAVLSEARARGFLGRGPVVEHVRHSEGFSEVLGASRGFRPRLLDLGSGGGVPGLVIAYQRAQACPWRAVDLVLLDSQRRRADFLEEAVELLSLRAQVAVVCERAEVAGRDPSLRGRFDAVTARAFGPPGVTAECGSPFLRVGGALVVSEPPAEAVRRWPAPDLARLGLSPGDSVQVGGFSYRRLNQVAPCPSRFPRRTGIPGKRPLFHVKPKRLLDMGGITGQTG